MCLMYSYTIEAELQVVISLVYVNLFYLTLGIKPVAQIMLNKNQLVERSQQFLRKVPCKFFENFLD